MNEDDYFFYLFSHPTIVHARLYAFYILIAVFIFVCVYT